MILGCSIGGGQTYFTDKEDHRNGGNSYKEELKGISPEISSRKSLPLPFSQVNCAKADKPTIPYVKMEECHGRDFGILQADI